MNHRKVLPESEGHLFPGYVDAESHEKSLVIPMDHVEEESKRLDNGQHPRELASAAQPSVA